MVGDEDVQLVQVGGCIVFCFYVCDLYLVLVFVQDGKLVCYCVCLDGQLLGVVVGGDVFVDGSGQVGEYCLYQLIC